MTGRSVPVSAMVGRMVRDESGRRIGRVEELSAEIDLHRHGNDYVVTRVVIGRYGELDHVPSAVQVVCSGRQRWRRWAGYRQYEIPWQWLDFGDPAHPRLRRAADDA